MLIILKSNNFSATPMFLEPLENVEVLVGRSVELQVEVVGKPSPTVTWLVVNGGLKTL